MQIIEVTDRKSAKEFIRTAIPIYKNYPQWIRPLDKDLEAVFDPGRNKHFRNGECTRWILKDNEGKCIGRVAAFINRKIVSKGNDQPVGGMGFFECINDKKAAFMLFDKCKAWLKERGMGAMDGPINFGERNEWWGLQVEGFDIEPNYRCNYNPPYYKDLFEAYGFKIYFEQLTFGRKIIGPISPKMFEKAKRIAENPKYHFKTLDIKQIDKFIEYFHSIYNKAWSGHKGIPVLSLTQARLLIKQLQPILDPKIMYFGFYEDDPIAFFINIPDVNQIFKHVNGKLNLIGKLKFVYHKWRKTTNKIIGIVFGVVPEHRSKGVEGAIVIYSRTILFEKYNRYENLELNWIGDFNPRMVHTVEQVGVELYKKHLTYRKLFDETKPFKRYPVLR
jgi:hypothetical protein